MVTETAFSALVLLVAIQRLFELRLSKQNEAEMRARGGREHAPEQMPWMKMLHAGWLVAMLVEVWLLARGFHAVGAGLALLVFVGGQVLRRAAIRSLGDRWSVRIMTVPGEAVRKTRLFTWVRHPNYLGVCLEIAALPLVHGAWLTALVFSVLNGALLSWRIREEEKALALDEDYAEAFPRSSLGSVSKGGIRARAQGTELPGARARNPQDPWR